MNEMLRELAAVAFRFEKALTALRDGDPWTAHRWWYSGSYALLLIERKYR